MGQHGTVRIGTSGYQYDHWSGIFYPEDLPKAHWFEHYARHFDTVEINNTFYQLPDLNTFDNWRSQAPEGFRFSLKYSRYGSHLKRLKEPREALGKFTNRVDRLAEHLGPILVQLPPNWHVNSERLAGFLAAAPTSYRWAVEFRDPSWLCPEVFELLRLHGAALCIHDLLPEHPSEVTTDWVYLRFHGGHYDGNYSAEQLSSEAGRIADWASRGLDVYVYFNNDLNGHAVHNARDLRGCLEREAPMFIPHPTGEPAGHPASDPPPPHR